MRGARLGLAVLGAGMALAGGPSAAAQPTAGWPQESPGDALSRHLKTLVANPRSVDALTGAGRAALDVGDAQAALSFLARAEDEAPRDGRIKMWIGSALVQLEQPHAALKFFKDAAELGVSDAEIARDRGLAYDIAGDQRHAQRDYRAALQRVHDPEVVRRLALSLAIGGDREQALRVLEEQLATRNPAAERTRALVLALTGDVADAGQAVQSSMPGPQGQALMPFLARLPALSPADRALAVHLGHFPQDGRSAAPSTYAMNSFRANVATTPVPSRGAFAAGRPDPNQPGLGRSTASLVRAAPPQQETPPPTDRELAPPVRVQSVPHPAPARPTQVAPAPVRTQVAARAPGPSQPSDWAWSGRVLARPQPRAVESRPAGGEPAAPVTDSPAPGPSPAATPPPPAAGPSSSPAQAPVIALAQPLDIGRTRVTEPTEIAPPVAHPPAAPAPRQSRLADLAATVATLPDAVVPKAPAARAAAVRPPAPKLAATPAKKPAPTTKAAPKEASRHWVQLGIGEDDTLPAEFARLKSKAGKLLAARSGWTAPMGQTNRILVGPFATKDDAQDFVNELSEKKVRAFAWTSAAGEKVAKLPAK